MKCPICGLDFFLGKCPHNSITLIREVERLKKINRKLELALEEWHSGEKLI